MEHVHAFYSKIDFGELEVVIEKTSEVVATNLERSLSSRKELATNTKEFRSNPIEQQLQQLGTFVKKYQVEVDDLTARALYAEKAFQKLALAFGRAPDPTPILKTAMVQLPKVKELRKKNKILKEEVSELEKEFDGLSNQDITIRELQLQIQSLEQGNDTKVQGIAAQHVEELELEFQEKAKILEEEKELLTKKIQTIRTNEIEAQTRADVVESQLFAAKSRAEENVAALTFDLELMTTETKRVQEKCTELELQLAESNGNRNQGRNGGSGGSGGSGSSRSSGDGSGGSGGSGGTATKEHEKETIALRDEVIVKNAQLMRAKAEVEKWKALSKRNSSSTVARASPVQVIEEGLELSKAYDTVKSYREQMIAFNKQVMLVAKRIGAGGDTGDTSATGDNDIVSERRESSERIDEKEHTWQKPQKDGMDGMDGMGNNKEVNLERLHHVLLSIGRQYETKTTNLRNDVALKEIELHSLQQTMVEKEKEMQRQGTLINTLEQEIETTGHIETSNGTTGTPRHTSLKTLSNDEGTAASSVSLNKSASLLANMLVDASGSSSPLFLTTTPSRSSSSSSSSSSFSSSPMPASASPSTGSMVSILTAQRDRYRERVHELELKVAASSLPSKSSSRGEGRNRTDYDQLYKENLKLNLQLQKMTKNNNNNNNNRRSTTATMLGDLELGTPMGGGGGERGGSNINRKRKDNRHSSATASMNPLDTMLYSIARLVMMNKYSRLIVFGYVLLLHGVLFLTLHNWSHAHHLAHQMGSTAVVVTHKSLARAKFVGSQ